MTLARTQALHKLLIVVGLLFFLLVTLQAPAQTLNHKMDVELLPGLKMIKAQDTIRFPKESPRKISFLLHKDLNVSVISPDDTVTLIHPATQDEPYAEYGLTLGGQDDKVTVAYYGVIFDPIRNQDSSGLISPEGAALFGSTRWYPEFLGQQKNFDITVKTPGTWRTLVQGQMTSLEIKQDATITRFTEIYPQEDIYLVAAPFTVHASQMPNGKSLQVFLRKDDPALAQTFLTLARDYIDHYSQLIAPFPYSSFSVVENMWETGYGMPGFTLLGPSVIRLPFIQTTSLPHEVLHNWWGNSVYVDYSRGNWSEGLTTYMADYWQAEKSGTDRSYRMNALMNFADFVTTNPEKDFPLIEFRGRHNSSSQAVGYSKAMMFFHMLDLKVGRAAFQKALQDFYTNNVYKRASFDDIQASFQKGSRENLSFFFSQWTERLGAPEVALTDAKLMRWMDGSFNLSFDLAQLQRKIYDLDIPVVITLETGEEARFTARSSGASQTTVFTTSVRPVKIALDPDFHIFRKIYPEERPATLSSVLGSPSVHFYSEQKNKGAQKFIQAWQKSIEGKTTSQFIENNAPLADEGALVFVGDAPAFAEFMKSELSDQKFSLSETVLKVNDQEFPLFNTSSVIVTRMKGRGQNLAWVRWSADNNPQEWAQRLTHYGSFGILIFQGRPVVLKSVWPVTSSPLQKNL